MHGEPVLEGTALMSVAEYEAHQCDCTHGQFDFNQG